MNITSVNGKYVLTIKKDRFLRGEEVRITFDDIAKALVFMHWLNGGGDSVIAQGLLEEVRYQYDSGGNDE